MEMKHRPLIANGLVVLFCLWALSASVDALWLWLDRSMPSWDPADHLIGSLNYWWSLQHPQWGSGEWWQGLWQLSSKYPPLLYIATSPLLSGLGQGEDQAVLINIGFTALLLGSVYGLGRHLFDHTVGLWAAGLCLLFPRLYTVRLQYFMDYPLVALVTLSLFCLTRWRDAKGMPQGLWALAFGGSLGLALLMKQSAVMFFVVPLLLAGGQRIWRRAWGQVTQLFCAGGIAIALLLPWLRTNWLFQISAGVNSNVRSAIAEGDPPLHTLAAWTYYLQDLPQALSWPLLILPIGGLLLSLLGRRGLNPSAQPSAATKAAFYWLLVFLGGAYLIWSSILNKDTRYVMPALPGLAVLLGYGLTRWQGRWRSLRWATIGLASGLLVLNLFPVAGNWGQRLTQVFSPNSTQWATVGLNWPHQQAIDSIIQTQPYQLVNLGVLHSTATVNQHNLTYFGNRRNFQVYARRVGNDDDYVGQDLRSLAWFLTKTGRDAIDSRKTREQREQMIQQLRDRQQFQRWGSWDLPDGDRLLLFRRRILPVEVQPVALPSSHLQLSQVIVPEKTPPGQPVPVTYEWMGTWEQLQRGLVLLTWRDRTLASEARTDETNHWIHDHAIGLGTLTPQPIQANQSTLAAAMVEPTRQFRVIERTAMLPPLEAQPGVYTLEATYLNRYTGQTFPLTVPPMTLTLDRTAAIAPAPELDWVTQLRQQAVQLPQGLAALEDVFAQLGRLNLYDPIQNYAVQAEETLQYRLQQTPQVEDAYGLVLSRVLQRKLQPAIAALEQVVTLDAQNPSAYAYLGALYLYALRPRAAQQTLDTALSLQPTSPELHGMRAIAALLQGNLVQAWQDVQVVLPLLERQSAPRSD